MHSTNPHFALRLFFTHHPKNQCLGCLGKWRIDRNTSLVDWQRSAKCSQAFRSILNTIHGFVIFELEQRERTHIGRAFIAPKTWKRQTKVKNRRLFPLRPPKSMSSSASFYHLLDTHPHNTGNFMGCLFLLTRSFLRTALRLDLVQVRSVFDFDSSLTWFFVSCQFRNWTQKFLYQIRFGFEF